MKAVFTTFVDNYYNQKRQRCLVIFMIYLLFNTFTVLSNTLQYKSVAVCSVHFIWLKIDSVPSLHVTQFWTNHEHEIALFNPVK